MTTVNNKCAINLTLPKLILHKVKMMNSLRFILQFLLILLLSPPLFADLESGLKSCVNTADNQQRLACYDQLAKNLKSQPGQWQIKSTPSLLDNTMNVSLSLQSAQPVKSRTQTVRPILTLQCKDKISSAQLHWNVYLGKNRTKVLTKTGSLEAIKQHWNIDTDNRTVSYSGNSDQFIKQLISQPTLTVQISPYNAEPIIATFNTRGLAGAIKQANISCQW